MIEPYPKSAATVNAEGVLAVTKAGKDMKLSYSGVWWGAMTEQQA